MIATLHLRIINGELIVMERERKREIETKFEFQSRENDIFSMNSNPINSHHRQRKKKNIGWTIPPLASRDVANAQRIEQPCVKIRPILSLWVLLLDVFIPCISK
jgi:hypothetical protein